MFTKITMELDQYEDYIDYLSRRVTKDDVKVVYYSYRTGRVKNVILRIERNFYSEEKLEKVLATKSGGFIDNHTAYEVTFADGSTIAIRCDDDIMSIGVGMDKGFK